MSGRQRIRLERSLAYFRNRRKEFADGTHAARILDLAIEDLLGQLDER